MTEKHRNAKGQFTAGNASGNRKPNRLLKTLDGTNIFAIARNVAPEMLEVLYKIAMNGKEKPLVRVAAANSMLDRGLGKAVSHTVISADVAAMDMKEVDITKLSEEKLMLLIAQHEKQSPDSNVIDADFEECQAVEEVNKSS